jgi:hypothetical protein
MKSLVLIIPAPLRDEANALGAALDMGPDNYSVPLSANGQEPATHWGLHGWAQQSFIDMIDAGVMPEGLDYPQADFDAVMAALIVSARDDMTGHFADVLDANGLTAVEMEEAPQEPELSQLDHDGDGNPGGSLPASERGLDDLWDEYREVTGEEPDKRWGATRLRAEIDAAREAQEAADEAE